jgi:hydroxyethylthiazole kinase-like uncharacterized protein yjeF
MIYALTARQMRDAEERAVADGITVDDLMRRAGTALADACAERVPEGAIAVLAGAGNNGGDGWTAARVLHQAGRSVHVFCVREPETLEGTAAEAAGEALEAGVSWTGQTPQGPSPAELAKYPAVIDALLGIGLAGPVRPALVPWIETCNGVGAYVVSADVPSGVDSDLGHVEGVAVQADATVTFSAPKVGLVQFPGAGYAGEVIVADVGVPGAFLLADGAPEIWSQAEYRTLLPIPSPDDHKNLRGRVLVVAGSGAYPGAAVLAAVGAQRMGAGYVTLACPESAVSAARSHLTSAVVVGMPENPSHTFTSKDAERLLDLARDYDAVVLGPGLTVSRGAVVVARTLASQLPMPLVIDADALNSLVDATAILAERQVPTVMTPHPGEAGRLLGRSTIDVQADRLGAVRELAGDSVACVLKGAGTLVALGGRLAVNTSGSVALATAGTGDVLAGMVGTLLAQGLGPLEAGALGAYVHGRAGEAAAETLTPVCVRAEDVCDHIPEAVAELLGDW